jgi:aryl carrier-like protein
MTFEQWQAASAPKIQGTWNLHEAFMEQKQPLDFFLLFSSLSGITGQVGQANYAAANTFLDAFVQYRHSLGLPASVLDIGAMEDIGYLSQNNRLLDSIKATSLYTLNERDLVNSLQMMINRSNPADELSKITSSPLTRASVNPSQVGLGLRSTLPLSAPNNRILWKRDARMAVYRNLEYSSSEADSVSNSEGLKRFLLDCQKNPAGLDLPESIDFLAQEIGTTLGGFMMRTTDGLDMNTPISSLGVDSLVSIELKEWFKKKIGVEFTVLQLVNAASLRALGEQAASQLKEKLQARL